jgi:hypothetical protein
MLLKILVIVAVSFALQASANEKLPADVRAFIADREGCDHMRGEIPDPPDPQRMEEVNREIDKLCKGTDRRLAGLKRKYAANRVVAKRLNAFEPRIEASQPHRGAHR